MEHLPNKTDEHDWPTIDIWVWLFTNDYIPPWMTFQHLRKEWKRYMKRE